MVMICGQYRVWRDTVNIIENEAFHGDSFSKLGEHNGHRNVQSESCAKTWDLATVKIRHSRWIMASETIHGQYSKFPSNV